MFKNNLIIFKAEMQKIFKNIHFDLASAQKLDVLLKKECNYIGLYSYVLTR